MDSFDTLVCPKCGAYFFSAVIQNGKTLILTCRSCSGTITRRWN